MSDQRTYDSVVEAMGHRISYYYRLDDAELTDELKGQLDEEAERRAREMVAQDYIGGELNCTFIWNDGEEQEFSGWWSIKCT